MVKMLIGKSFREYAEAYSQILSALKQGREVKIWAEDWEGDDPFPSSVHTINLILTPSAEGVRIWLRDWTETSHGAAEAVHDEDSLFWSWDEVRSQLWDWLRFASSHWKEWGWRVLKG